MDINRLMGVPAGVYGNTVRDRFMRQLMGARGLQIPAGYAFHKNAALLPPNLMQRLVAYRLLQEHSVGNWSDTGAGKTLAAILASRVVDSRLTVIVALNNTLEQWAAVISNAFPDSVVVVKPKDELVIALQRHTYVLLNFEAFGDKRKAPVLLRRLLERQVAMIVLDEVHNPKYREGEASTRRKNLQALLCAARAESRSLRAGHVGHAGDQYARRRQKPAGDAAGPRAGGAGHGRDDVQAIEPKVEAPCLP